MELNYKSFGSGEPLIILHGLLGSLDNWQTLAKKYAEHFTVFIIDQRNHGKTPHSNEFDYSILTQDLYHFMEDHHIYSSHLLGHSMGGKVVMQFALEYPDMVDKLIVADIAPVNYIGGHEVIFQSLLNVDLDTISSREEVDAQLKRTIPETGVRQFLMKGLTRGKEKNFVWKYNVQALWANYHAILSSFESSDKFDGETLFVRGGLSKYVDENGIREIENYFTNYSLETIANVGHWLHAENPKEFLAKTSSFLLD